MLLNAAASETMPRALDRGRPSAGRAERRPARASSASSGGILPTEAYDRVAWLFSRLSHVLEMAPDGIDAAVVANRLARAAVPESLLTSRSIAVDGTDVESWGALQGASRLVELSMVRRWRDFQLIDEPTGASAGTKERDRRVHTAKVFGTGEDGRKRYTKDPDARAGHRSATNQRPAGPYIGYELHLAVQARDVRWTNFIDNTTLEAEVAGVITTCALVPAGTHRGRAIVDGLVAASKEFHEIDDVVWDPGYSLCQPETTTHLHLLGALWDRARRCSPSCTNEGSDRSPATRCCSMANSSRPCSRWSSGTWRCRRGALPRPIEEPSKRHSIAVRGGASFATVGLTPTG